MLLKYQRYSKHPSAVLSTGIFECPLGEAHRASALVAVSTGVPLRLHVSNSKTILSRTFYDILCQVTLMSQRFLDTSSLIFLCRVTTASELILLFILEDLAMTISEELWDAVT